MDNQEMLDVLVLTMPDSQAIALFESNREAFEENNSMSHYLIMQGLVQAIDNVYGEGSFDVYKNSGILPSQQ